MKQYIDKAAVVAEIEKKIKEIEEIGTYLSPKGTLTNLLCYVNALEVKEAGYELAADELELKKIEQEGTKQHAEDDKVFDYILYIMNQLKGSAMYAEDDIAEECINWLKSLKSMNYPQLKQEWSEYDQDMLVAIDCLTKQGRHLEKEHLNWLKSLKERIKER